MDMPPGRSIYSPDEELKQLRPPKTYRPPADAQQQQQQQQQQQHQQGKPTSAVDLLQQGKLSINAMEFVPRYPVQIPHNNVQDRLTRIQQQYIQENYPQQQQQQQQQQQAQQYNQQPSYANGYGGGYQQQQQSLNQQFSSMSVQDRLHRSNNSASGSNASNSSNNSTFYPQQREYQPNQSYHRNNKYHHHNHNNHHHHNNQQSRYNNHHYNQQNHQQYHNNHHNHHHQPRNQPYSQQQQQQQAQYSNQAAGAGAGAAAAAAADAAPDMQNIALDYLQTVIQCLNQNPGQFDTIAPRFINIFDGMESNHYVLSIAMEDIFEESIKNPNFRYMGAKLYNLLHMFNPSKDSLFHTLLKCKLDFHQDEIKNYMQSNQQGKVRETALFLAELYMQLRGDDTRLYLIAENIVYSLKQLLEHVVAENVRCICLTLKLAGYDLSTDCPEEMKEIIASLERINAENPGKYPLASNVISLQKNNWGRKAPGSEGLGEGESSKPAEPPRQSDDPVFYGPDGREITAEECEFLTNGASGANGGSTDNDDDNDLDDLDPEMDEETERDYKLFLKQANNS